MQLSAYWWAPLRGVKNIIVQLRYNSRAWLYLLRRSKGSVSNFGDALNVVVLGYLSGSKPRWSSLKRCQVVCIGSVLNTYVASKSSALVFGSGVRDPRIFDVSTDPLIPSSRCISVRGALTRSAMRLPHDTLIGEPGLLISQIVAAEPSADGANITGLLPHFSEFRHDESRTQIKEAEARGFRVLYPNANPEDLAREISSLDLLVTSSLHGLVFAHAYGVPAQLVSFRAKNSEESFKFDDYLSVFGIESNFRSMDEVVEMPVGDIIRGCEAQTAAVAKQLKSVQEKVVEAYQKLELALQTE